MTPSRGTGESEARSSLTVALFVIYLLGLIGLIVFKFPFSYDGSTAGRELNLIPLAGSFSSDGAFDFGEVIENILVFVPFGIYISMVNGDWSFRKKIVPIIVVSVAFETIQYAFSIGRADITDLLGNTLGGVIGIGLYVALSKILRSRTRLVLNVAGLVLTAGAALIFVIVLLHTLRAR